MALYWVALVVLWVGAIAGIFTVALYTLTARWWDSPVGISLVAHISIVAFLLAASAVVQLAVGPYPVIAFNFVVVLLLAIAEVFQAIVFYRRHRRQREKRKGRQ